MKKLSKYVLAAALLVSAPIFCAPWQAAAQGRTLGAVPDRREARLFDRHTVRMGETAYSIARGYGLSPATLAEDNEGVDITRIRPGQILLIRKRERGRTTPEQVAREWARISRSATMPGEAEEDTAAQDHADAAAGNGNGSSGTTVQQGLFGGTQRREVRAPRDFSRGGTPRVAMLLPLGGDAGDFTDFCNGALVALEALKAEGRSLSLTIYDSERSAAKVESIVSSADFADTDLIIGPVLEQELEPAVRFGDLTGVPVVSPLASVGRVDGPTLYQMAPDAATKYDKLRPLVEGDVNIIVVSSGAADDAEFRGEMEALLRGRSVRRFTVGQGNVVSLLDWERPNVLVVLGDGQAAVDTALKTVSSSYNHASATRSRRAQISVVGSSKWAFYNSTTNLTELMFKLNTHFVTSYYVNRWNRATSLFEARYLELHAGFPSRAAFRGYDAVALFGGALFRTGGTFAERLEKMSAADAFGDGRLTSTVAAGTTGAAGAAGSVGSVGSVQAGANGGYGVLSGAGSDVAMPLGTPYRFVRGGGTLLFGMNDAESDGVMRGGHYTNDQWTLVSLTDDFNVTAR